MVRRAMRFHRSLVIIAFEHSIDSGFGGAEQLVIAVPGLVRLHRGGEFGEHALERLFLAGLHAPRDRQSVVEGKSVYVRVDLGGRRILKKKKRYNKADKQ